MCCFEEQHFLPFYCFLGFKRLQNETLCSPFCFVIIYYFGGKNSLTLNQSNRGKPSLYILIIIIIIIVIIIIIIVVVVVVVVIVITSTPKQVRTIKLRGLKN